jgi:hypothetical protein
VHDPLQLQRLGRTGHKKWPKRCIIAILYTTESKQRQQAKWRCSLVAATLCSIYVDKETALFGLDLPLKEN